MKPKLKSILDATWKVGLGLVGIGAAVIGVLVACTWYENTYGRAYWKDRALSRNISVHYFNNNRARVWDRRAARYVSPKLLWVSGAPARDSITVYCTPEGYRGYLNCNTGKIVIPAERARYRRAWQFSEGAAFVVLEGQDSLSIIDYAGNVLARNVANYSEGYDYVFEDGICRISEFNKCGILAKDGTWAVEQKYYDIDYPNTFGYRIARDKEGYWIFDPELKLVFDSPCDYISFAIGRNEGSGTLYLTRNHVKQLVNYDGTVVEPFVIDDTYELRYMIAFNEDIENEYALDPDLAVYRVDSWEGLMNKHTGRILTKAVYTDFKMISKDLIRANLGFDLNHEAVVMDRTGRVIKQ